MMPLEPFAFAFAGCCVRGVHLLGSRSGLAVPRARPPLRPLQCGFYGQSFDTCKRSRTGPEHSAVGLSSPTAFRRPWCSSQHRYCSNTYQGTAWHLDGCGGKLVNQPQFPWEGSWARQRSAYTEGVKSNSPQSQRGRRRPLLRLDLTKRPAH